MPIEAPIVCAHRSVLAIGPAAVLLDRASFFREVGAHLVTAPSGPEAVLLSTSMPFDVILTSVELPVMSGFEVATRILRGEANRGARVLFLTRDPRSVEGLSNLSEGQLDGLLAPCSSSMLCAKLRAMLAPRTPPGALRRVS